jgi:hypothetical protein
VGGLRIGGPTAFLQKPGGLDHLGVTLRRLLDGDRSPALGR